MGEGLVQRLDRTQINNLGDKQQRDTAKASDELLSFCRLRSGGLRGHRLCGLRNRRYCLARALTPMRFCGLRSSPGRGGRQFRFRLGFKVEFNFRFSLRRKLDVLRPQGGIAVQYWGHFAFSSPSRKVVRKTARFVLAIFEHVDDKGLDRQLGGGVQYCTPPQ